MVMEFRRWIKGRQSLANKSPSAPLMWPVCLHPSITTASHLPRARPREEIAMAASTASRLSPPRFHVPPQSPHPPLRRSRFFPVRAAKLEAVLSIGTHLIPHPRKAASGGEDAFFANSDAGGVFAIADGVSGWAEKDVNPALFSRELIRNSSNFLNDEEVNHDPQSLLMKAHAATSSIGSATVIIAMLEKTGTLKIASVGDCGLKIIRKGQVMFSIYPQEHYFDCPYQISSEAVGQTYRDALVCSVNLMEGDTIVSGSDGLFDNIFDQEIISIISESKGVDEAAKALAELARKHSVDVTFDSPYSMEARSRGFDVPWWKKLLGAKLIGGKMDDITVVVAQVKTLEVPDDEGGDIDEQKGNEQSVAVAVASAGQNEE